jgi:hypothetical protein
VEFKHSLFWIDNLKWNSHGKMRYSLLVLLSLTTASLQSHNCWQQPIRSKFVATSKYQMVMADFCTGDNKLDFSRVWANKFCTGSAIYLRGGCGTALKQEEQTQPNSTLDMLSFLSKVLGGLGGVAMSDEQTIMCVCRMRRTDAHYLINFAKFVLAAGQAA